MAVQKSKREGRSGKWIAAVREEVGDGVGGVFTACSNTNSPEKHIYYISGVCQGRRHYNLILVMITC